MKKQPPLQGFRLSAICILWIGAFCGMTACSKTSEKGQIQSAKAYIQAQNYKAATIELKTGLQTHPDSAELRFLFGQTLLRSGNAQAALLELEKARTLLYAPEALAPELARAMLGAGQPKQLLDRYINLAPLADPRSAADLKASIAAAQLAFGQITVGKATVAAALAADPANTAARLLQVRLTAGEGAIEAALSQLDVLLREQPETTAAWVLRGELLGSARNDRPAAAEAFRKALAIDPADLRAHAALIQLALEKNDLVTFKSQIAALAAAAPDSFEHRFYKAQLALLEGRFQAAREEVQQLLKATPKHAPLLQLAGTIELHSGTLPVAQTLLTQAVQIAPDVPAARRLLAEVDLRSGDTQRALAALRPVLAQTPPDAAALMLAARAYRMEGNPDKAQEAYAKAAKADPDDPAARIALAVMRIVSGDAPGGLTQLEGLAASDTSGQADFALVNARIERREFDKALSIIAKLSARAPREALPLLMRSRVQLMQGDRGAARASLESAVSTDPLNPTAVAALAALETAEGRAAAALSQLEALLVKRPDHVPIALMAAELQLRTGTAPDTVQSRLAEIVRRNPTDGAARLALVQVMLERHDAKRALAAAQDARATLPDDPRILDALGRAQLAAGDPAQAMDSFQKAAAAQPGLPQPYLRLAETFLAQRDYNAATQNLQRALAVSPGLVLAQTWLAKIALLRKRPSEALKIAHEMQQQRPDEAVGYLLEAEVQSTQKLWPQTTTASLAALKREPVTETAHKVYASYLYGSRPAEAAQFAAEWEKAHPKDAEFSFKAGALLAERGDAAGAEAQFRKALALVPDNALAINNIAASMVSQGKPGALALARKADGLAPGNAMILDTVAAALAADQQIDEAVKTQQSAVTKAPDTPLLRLNLAKLLVKAGQSQQARAELEKLAALGPGYAAQGEVTALLKNL